MRWLREQVNKGLDQGVWAKEPQTRHHPASQYEHGNMRSTTRRSRKDRQEESNGEHWSLSDKRSSERNRIPRTTPGRRLNLSICAQRDLLNCGPRGAGLLVVVRDWTRAWFQRTIRSSRSVSLYEQSKASPFQGIGSWLRPRS